MTRRLFALLASLMLPVAGMSGSLAAQTPAAPDTPPPASAQRTTTPESGAPGAEAPGQDPDEAGPAEVEPHFRPWGSSVFRLGQDHVVAAGSLVRELVVVMGSVDVQGTVTRDAVVVLGGARLSRDAAIEDSLVVIGGSVVIEPGARVDRDLVVVAGALETPEGFSPGGEQIVIGPAVLGSRLAAVTPWITRGLLWGRPIVPDVAWVWGVVGLFFLVYLALNILFGGAVQTITATLTERPLTTFVVGLLVLLLTAPICMLLAVSVVGLAAVPILLCALLVAALLGKVAVARWIGERIVPGERRPAEDGRPGSTVYFAAGCAALVIAYLIPLLGFTVWTLAGVLGLGAATLATIAAYRREHPPQAPAIDAARPAAAYASSGYGVSPAAASERTLAMSPAPGPDAVPHAADLVAFPRAAFHERLAAFALDIILVLIAHALLDLTDRNGAFFLFLLAYHIGFWTWKATTVGGIICQLRVVRVDGAPLRFVDALVRGLSSIFSLAVVGLGALWILRDPERQAWHDRIAGTYVVKVPRNWPL
jgi:uncharacterized RDD family membrane protein YckC